MMDEGFPGLITRGNWQELYPHTIMSVGWAEHDGQKVVVIRVMMGDAKFDFWLTPENAHQQAAALLGMARFIEYGTPALEAEPWG